GSYQSGHGHAPAGAGLAAAERNDTADEHRRPPSGRSFYPPGRRRQLGAPGRVLYRRTNPPVPAGGGGSAGPPWNGAAHPLAEHLWLAELPPMAGPVGPGGPGPVR